jgi:predicted RNA-binding protein with RPS1 domain
MMFHQNTGVGGSRVSRLKFSLKQFNEANFTSTGKAWLKKASSEISFPTEAHQILEWASSRLDLTTQGDSVAFGIFKDGADIAAAICEIAITRKTARSRWMKMLRVRLSPDLEMGVFDGSIEAMSDVQNVYVAAVAGVLKLKMEHNATILKIYGRSHEQLSLLKVLGIELEKHLKNHTIRMDGRWLTIENEQQ